MTVKISKKDEYQSTPYIDGNSDTNVNHKSKDDVHVKQPEEASIREKPQEKIHARQTRMVSSMLKEHENEQGHQCQLQSHRKEENWPMNALCKSSGKTISTQNEEYEQENQKNIQQVPSDELASSVMEATDSLIAGLMTLKAKVEEAYMKKGTGRPSHPMPVESDPESVSV
ncbi:hypothetical protein GDO81_009940 [Engystomops pustulosus]|uniref:Uncharacterized protein n=1 Tax=Engystomops pustulosus TaxID=76066 RepID=A0AAV7BW84_ENGPU|nr:hypothetical protein GDO81_009940 [Engystomops pustulosus]